MSILERMLQPLVEKLNPAQSQIVDKEGPMHGTTARTQYYKRAYDEFDVVRRGVDMIVNGVASFDFMIGEQLQNVIPTVSGTRKKKLDSLINYQPNPYQTVNVFRRLCVMDFLLDGNVFIYFDGAYIYHIPASNVVINADRKTLVEGYDFNGEKNKFKADEIIHIQDNAANTIYRGEPRLKAAETNLDILRKMLTFQANFFENGAVPGLVLTSPNVLGDKIKERLLNTWSVRYNPKSGGRRPMILDGGLEAKKLSDATFSELDFETSITNKEEAILTALGIPPILMAGGNNANIAPNLKLFYLETVLPIAAAFSSGFERYFGYDLEPETGKISALQPQMSEAGTFFTTLVNGGVITPNEARVELRWDPITDDPEMSKIRVPANIAGSAVDPSQGGRPSNPAKPKELND